jgi:hypothetical protein
MAEKIKLPSDDEVIVVHISHGECHPFLCNESNDHVTPLVAEHLVQAAVQGKRFVFTIRDQSGKAFETYAARFFPVPDAPA